jgi:3-hydroxymyristoyl/3-hydroxydecanoyl-(acyl carrier protein) dehydratase
MDAAQGNGLLPLSTVVAEMAAAGVDVRTDALRFPVRPAASGPVISIPARLPAPEFPALYTVLERAPDLLPTPPFTARPDPVTAAHRHFLTVQATAHQDFLATRAAALRVLTQARPPAQRPVFDRAQLEHLAVGRISEQFGPMFAVQDADVRQTRMPGPPLLLADRVTGIDAEPGSMGTGTIWTATDIVDGAWYLDATGRMPPGLLVEAGQADLLLISWLGADLHNRGRRVYRLLGSEVTCHASPPAPGTTLDYEIRIVDHVNHGQVRLFFFEYDCRCDGELILTVRQGQAGFFSDEELANTGGVLWDPAAVAAEAGVPVDPPAVRCLSTSFDAAAVEAFAAGHPDECFGPGWDVTRADVRSPRIGSGRLRLLDDVPVFDPEGGPWRRGYLRAGTAISQDDWFFDGHFHNDPCMPGTLMSEGCLQAVSFYLAACGFTIGRDGWRFEPVAGRPSRMRCRCQATPNSRHLTYEVFVSSVSAGPLPTVVADVLVTVDGVKALHVADCAVRLVPDWPLDHWRHLGPPTVQRTAQPVPLPALAGLAGHVDRRPVAEIEGLPLGYASLLACAWGRPTDGLGPMADAFLGPRRPPRLPGPPYLFMSRVTAVTGPYQGMTVGSTVDAEYDVPDEAWYFADNASPTMPVAALMEIALQPCGWLGCYVGSPVQLDTQLLFRNLDGDMIVHREVRPDTAIVHTRAELTAVSHINGMIIESFTIDCHADGEPLLHGTAVFGYFSAAAFADQSGLPPAQADRDRLVEPSPATPALYGERPLPGRMLMMLDRITGYWPTGGPAGLGRVRAETTVDPGAWFFRAHFFQDPVMPGSLGVEAMCQLLQWYMIETGVAPPGARFEPIALHERATWTYRGQIVPADGLITVELDVLEIRDATVHAEAWLWVDDRRIYHLNRFAMRAVHD